MSKQALVTGASSGIGNAYALELLRNEYDLIVVEVLGPSSTWLG